jgi:4-amino-4-deoxy-L-arabinose transferase-like glycosyltransferase
VRSATRFPRDLALLCALAFAIRILYAMVVAPAPSFLDDDGFFHLTANLMADGHGYVVPITSDLRAATVPTANHPILYPLLLSAIARLGGTSADAQRLVGVLAGTGVVALAGLLGRELASARAGLFTAAIVALWPSLVAADGSLMSESLYGLFVVAAVLLAVRHVRAPSVGGAVALGTAIGLAGLTRSEGLSLVLLLALPAVLMARERRWPSLLAVVITTTVVISPWVIRNWSTFGRPLLSTNEGTVVAGSNCHSTYYGSQLGGFDFACVKAAGVGIPTDNEARVAAHLRDVGLDYAEGHAGRLAVVVGVRLAAAGGLYAPKRQFVVTGRNITTQKAATILYYPLVLLAIGGAAVLWRRRERVALLLLGPLVMVCLVIASTYGGVRLRHPADLLIALLAGVAIDAALLSRLRVKTVPKPEPEASPVAG